MRKTLWNTRPHKESAAPVRMALRILGILRFLMMYAVFLLIEDGLKTALTMSATVILTEPRQMPVNARITNMAARTIPTVAGRLLCSVISEKLRVEDSGNFLDCVCGSYSLALSGIAIDGENVACF